MKPLFTLYIILAVLLVSSNISAQHPVNRPDRTDGREQHRVSVNNHPRHREQASKAELVAKVRRLEKRYERYLSYRDREELQRDVDEILMLIDELVADEIYFAPQPISVSEFMRLKENISNAPFSDSKKQILAASAANHFFVIEQVIEVLDMLSFDDSKFEAIQILYPKVLDRENSYLLFNCLTFSSTKEKFDSYIREFESGGAF
ncbi:MAG: DUF4476 domain-containing protein [Bacteroidales bacterium]|nr:DUF4476 domain-containing protein [Bacteroidales bacterium]